MVVDYEVVFGVKVEMIFVDEGEYSMCVIVVFVVGDFFDVIYFFF